jgi:hypothetical protein
MSLANQLNLTNVELGLLLVGGCVLFSFSALFLYLRRAIPRWVGRRTSSVDSDQIKEWIQQSEAICQDLSKNLQEKKTIANRLLAQLDERIRTLHDMVNGPGEKGAAFPQENKKCMDAEVCTLSKAGYDVSEIARSLRLPKGQVELILDLKRYCQ